MTGTQRETRDQPASAVVGAVKGLSLLDAALAYAEKGWHVLPLVPNGKKPWTEHGYKDATTDPGKIKAWWGETPDANIGLALIPSGLLAVDIDSYKPDCDWTAFSADLPIPDTLTQRSARGGTHLIFGAEDGATYRGKPCAGVDIKHEGYILAEPSTFDGGTYQWHDDAPIAPAPQWLKRPEKTLAETVGNVSGGSGATLAEVEEALQYVSPDCDYDTWLSVLMGIHDEFGDDGLILADEWSARAPHRYREGEVEEKFASFTGGEGCTIRTVFDLARKAGVDLGALRHKHFDLHKFFEPVDPANLPAAPGETIFDQKAKAERGNSPGGDTPGIIRPSRFVLRDPTTIPPRQWLYDRHLIRGFVSLTVAPGGLGKSSLLTSELLAMATGRPLLGAAPPEPLRVWWWNGEDPADELERRVAAACKHFDIGAGDYGDRLFVDSGRDLPISIASIGARGLKVAGPLIESLTAAIRAEKIDVLVIDPFVSSHTIPENESSAVNAVIEQWRNIANATGCAIELVHHVNKAAAMNTDAAGIYGSRGAGALIDGIRSGRYLSRMTNDEATRLGLEAPEQYFRVESGKQNLTPLGKAAWRRMVGVPLHNGTDHWPEGDVIGVCVAWTPPEALDGITEGDVRTALAAFRARRDPARLDQKAGDWAGYVIAEALGLDPGRGLAAKEQTGPQKAARAQVRGLLKEWLRQGLLQVERGRDVRKGADVDFVVIGSSKQEPDENIFG
ncbi:AAA family ATPase [uncultured Paracoccus sp.]|uniref:AAA family ATPase n=1 Tax=uncultured Paracoccus sp. TaxID=189685 RepID=UPI00260C4BDF|nr:AAA family ATPase [uncultured Paracoccus sp.]